MTFSETLEQTGEFVLLKSNADYEKYFALLNRAFELLIKWYRDVVVGGDYEEVIVENFLSRMLFTTKLLALKVSHNPEPMLRLDLKDSGYPHLLGILGIETDLRQRTDLLRNYEPADVIKQAMLTCMLEKKEDPRDLSANLAFRRYLELLDETKVILPFTPGALVLKSEDDAMRHYMFSWCCYDVKTNIPHVYIMLFEQNASEEPLHQEGMSRSRFMSVVQEEGSRAPTLDVVAISIDQQIESVHPKILKRIKLGPILTTAYSREDYSLLRYLREHGRKDDFIFHIRDEMVFSATQVARKTGWFSPEKISQIFYVPQDNLECSKAGVSRIHRMMMLPHNLLQHLQMDDPVVTQYQSRITYTSKGELNGI